MPQQDQDQNNNKHQSKSTTQYIAATIKRAATNAAKATQQNMVVGIR